MNNDWQMWVALGIVAVAALLLLRTAWRRRSGKGGCGCESGACGAKLGAGRRPPGRR
jgi:hypothetical protein